MEVLLPAVTIPCESTVTLLYVPAVTPEFASAIVVFPFAVVAVIGAVPAMLVLLPVVTHPIISTVTLL